MSRSLVLSFCLFILFANSIAQSSPGYHIQEYTTDNGMPSNGIKGMQWDEETGFLWIATEAGMTRFNGMSFANFTKENTPAISHERMYFLVKDKNKNIIGADVGKHMFTIRNNSVRELKLPAWKEIPLIKLGAFLQYTGDAPVRALYRIYRQTLDTVWLDVYELKNQLMLVALPQGRFYLASGLDSNLRRHVIPSQYTAPFVIEQELFVIGKDRKVYRVTNDFTFFEPVNIVTETGNPVMLGSDNHLIYSSIPGEDPILFSENFAWYLHSDNGRIRAELICSEVPSSSYIRVAQYSRKNKTLFIGTDSKGLIMIQENRVKPYKKTKTDIRERNAYYSQVELEDGNVLTNESHIIGPSAISNTRIPIQGKFDFSVYTTGDSLLWYSQYSTTANNNTLHKYNYRSGKTHSFDNIEVGSNFVLTALKGKYFVGSTKGLGWLEGDSIRFLFNPDTRKKQIAPPNAIVEFSTDRLGIASCDGLVMYNLSNKRVDTLLNPFGYCIRSLWKYKDYVFIGSYGKGFYIWRDGKIKSMPLDKNNFLLFTHCFKPDRFGFIWLSTNRGLFKAQLSDLIQAYEKDMPQVYYHYFGKNDGMDITEMNGGCSPCALELKNNWLSFPTMDGLLWVDPATANPLFPEGNIFIDEFIAGNKKINPDSIGQYSFPPAYRDIFIRLGFSAWCNKENVYLEYQVNRNGDWIPVDIDNGAAINLYNLSPGSYHISIRKLNGFGSDNYSYKDIRFSIKTPWTRSWWFYLLCALLLFGVVTLYLQFRTRQYKIRQRKLELQVFEKTKELQDQNRILEKNNTIKTRLISIISHDIITPLKFLTAAGKNLLEKRMMMSESLQDETIKEITNTSQELQLLSTNILNWIKYQNENRLMAKEKFDLSEMVNQVIGILKSLAKQKNIILENKIEENTPIYQYYEPLKILVYNLLTNAIQFTERGQIIIETKNQPGSITISVVDQGIGMTPEQVQRLMGEDVVITSANVDNKKGHGLGYLIIKDLVKTMDAQLSIESKKEQGTRVSVEMPVSGNNNLPSPDNKL